MGTVKECTQPGCGRLHKARGLCAKHYLRLRKHGSPDVTLRPYPTKQVPGCSVQGCTTERYSFGLCRLHHNRTVTFGSTDLPEREVILCEVCQQPAKARLMCELHLARWYKTGSTDDPQRPTDEERFWAKVPAVPNWECWEWQGSRHPHGHGYAVVDGRVVYAHRYSLELALGRPLRPGAFACHHCDNPPCVNPAHLYEGDSQSNIDDMIRRGRAWWQKGHRERKTDSRKGQR